MAQCKIHTLFFAFGNLIAKQFYNYVPILNLNLSLHMALQDLKNFG